MTIDPYSRRHQDQHAAQDADQAEFLAFKNGVTVVDVGIYDERIAGVMDDVSGSEPTGGAMWHAEDLTYDSAVGKIYEEIERRRDTMGPLYPFSIEGGTLSYTPNGSVLYVFLLAICNARTLSSGQYVGLPRVFERLSARLVAAYLGAGGRFIHTGVPRDAAVGSSFKKAMATVSDRTGEWTWGPDEGLPDEPSSGDSGCDFVVWVRSPDGRGIGQLFLIGQCACGNDWQSKLSDLTVKKLAKWFNPMTIVEPVRCFATPFHVTDAMLTEASREGGIVFDRARLVGIVSEDIDDVLDADIRENMDRLITLVVEE